MNSFKQQSTVENKAELNSAGAIGLRAAAPTDRTFSETLFFENHLGPIRLAGWNEDQIRAFLSPQFIMREKHLRQKYPRAEYRVVQLDGVDVGRLVVNREQYDIHIIDIAILENRRRRGIGSHLLATLCEEADAAGKTVSLQVAFDNPAINLYLCFGFELSGDEDVYRFMQRQPEAANVKSNKVNKS